MLNPSANLPLWYQLAVSLRGRIQRGLYPPGTAIPPELQLAREFGVSRATIRQALGVLVRQGLLVRRRGAGSVVAATGARPEAAAFTGYLEDLLTLFTATTVVRVQVEEVEAPPAARAFLGQKRVVRVHRVRQLDGEVFTVADSYLPLEVADRLTPEDFRAYPMIEMVEHLGGDPVGEAEQSVSARVASAEVAAALALSPGSPVLFVEIGYRSVAGHPLAWTEISYHPDRYQYRMRLVRLDSAGTLRRGRPRRAPDHRKPEGGTQ